MNEKIFSELEKKEKDTFSFFYPTSSVDPSTINRTEIPGFIEKLEKMYRYITSLENSILPAYMDLKIKNFTPDKTDILRQELSSFARKTNIDIQHLKRL